MLKEAIIQSYPIHPNLNFVSIKICRLLIAGILNPIKVWYGDVSSLSDGAVVVRSAGYSMCKVIGYLVQYS